MSCIIHRSGAETELFGNLAQRGIHRFSSIDEMISFQRNHLVEIENFRRHKAAEITAETENLSHEIESLRAEYERRHTEQVKFANNRIAQIKTKLSDSSRNLVSRIKAYTSLYVVVPQTQNRLGL